MPSFFVISVTDPTGACLCASFELVPDQQYRPADVLVLNAPPVLPGARVLSVNTQRLPDERDFQVMAAAAATRAAREPRTPEDEVNRMLFPLG